jgi:hypothetical protein
MNLRTFFKQLLCFHTTTDTSDVETFTITDESDMVEGEIDFKFNRCVRCNKLRLHIIATRKFEHKLTLKEYKARKEVLTQ